MERTHKIRQAGYLPLPRLLELNRDALRAYDKHGERQTAGKRLIREIVGWCALSSEEALGLLEACKFSFLVENEDGPSYKLIRKSKSK